LFSQRGKGIETLLDAFEIPLDRPAQSVAKVHGQSQAVPDQSQTG
jgi:hypothetical protein